MMQIEFPAITPVSHDPPEIILIGSYCSSNISHYYDIIIIRSNISYCYDIIMISVQNITAAYYFIWYGKWYIFVRFFEK